MPDYKNPPIQEVVCEFSFVPPPGDHDWDLTIPGKLQVHPDFAEYSAPSKQQYMQALAPAQRGQPQLAISNILFRVQLPRPDGRALIAVGANILGVIVLKPYEGWEKFRPRILKALKAYSETTKQTAVQRIGIRYINRIVVPSQPAAAVSAYLTNIRTNISAVTETSNVIDGNLIALNSRHEFETIDRIKILLTQATLQPEDPKTSEYLVDTDVVCDSQVLDGLDQITPVMDKLHDTQGGLFESLITDEARKLFNEA